MTDTIGGVDAPVAGPVQTGQEHDVTTADAVRELSKAEQALVSDLVRSSRAQGVALTGPDGLLKALTKSVLEAALAANFETLIKADQANAAATGVVLIVITLTLNSAAILVRARMRRRIKW